MDRDGAGTLDDEPDVHLDRIVRQDALTLSAHGNSATRQRAAAHSGLLGVVDAVCAETKEDL